jgi:splicing factor 3A subunit 1
LVKGLWSRKDSLHHVTDIRSPDDFSEPQDSRSTTLGASIIITSVMAPTATDTAAAQAVLDDTVSKHPPGVVLPPKDIRTIVETTAGYVARAGAVFENRIREKEGKNPKFSFLFAHDAYNPYYLWRLNEVREGRGTAISAGRVGEDVKKEPEKPKGPEQPPEFAFSARMPNISAQDLDVVKLTALFVAKNGRVFATTLAQRESTSSQFDFLRPQHSLYQFFTRLVDQYSALLNGGIVDGGKPEKQRLAALEKNVEDKFNVLERARKRAEWVKFQEAQKEEKEAEEEAERLSFAQIDWHDFVVVETVVFTDADASTDLPPPTSLSDLQTASLEQKASMSLAPSHMRLEEAFPSYEDYTLPVHAPPPPQVPYTAPGAYPLPGPTQAPPPQLDILHPPPQPAAPIKVQQAPVPRAMAKRRNVQTAQCPNCKQQIPLDEMEQHMRSNCSLLITLTY